MMIYLAVGWRCAPATPIIIRVPTLLGLSGRYVTYLANELCRGSGIIEQCHMHL